VGECSIAENEDYEKWALEIRVKFRESENLFVLTRQRQSGGVRALRKFLSPFCCLTFMIIF